ncbi:MAG: hypothetical protein KatS3mg003_0646 [Candidatus Nitrosocaldaceae archaeon]|nr:MAG: hypothetical protein KatS3mg003_0646 [Candidatus Nitrosocaldaceae archaeon]
MRIKYGEIRCDKEYIVAPPSIHEKTLDSYKTITNNEPVILNLEEAEIVYNTAIEVLGVSKKKQGKSKKGKSRKKGKSINIDINANELDDIIFDLIKPFYKHGYRYNIVKHLTGWLSREDIDYSIAYSIVTRLIEYNNDEEADNRLLLLERAYSDRDKLTGFPSLKELLASIDENGEEVADNLMDIVNYYKKYLFGDIDTLLLNIDTLSMWRDIKNNTRNPRDYQMAINTIDKIKEYRYYICIVCKRGYIDYNDAIDCYISHKDMLKSIKARRHYYISLFDDLIYAMKHGDIEEVLEKMRHEGHGYICYCMKEFDDIEEWIRDMLYHIHLDKISNSNNEMLEDMLRIYEDDIEDYDSRRSI